MNELNLLIHTCSQTRTGINLNVVWKYLHSLQVCKENQHEFDKISCLALASLTRSLRKVPRTKQHLFYSTCDLMEAKRKTLIYSWKNNKFELVYQITFSILLIKQLLHNLIASIYSMLIAKWTKNGNAQLYSTAPKSAEICENATQVAVCVTVRYKFETEPLVCGKSGSIDSGCIQTMQCSMNNWFRRMLSLATQTIWAHRLDHNGISDSIKCGVGVWRRCVLRRVHRVSFDMPKPVPYQQQQQDRPSTNGISHHLKIFSRFPHTVPCDMRRAVHSIRCAIRILSTFEWKASANMRSVRIQLAAVTVRAFP